MKILMIGPLPKDVGGSYTTGVGKVVLELSHQDYGTNKLYVSSTNIRHKNASANSQYPNQYNGYRWLILDIISDLVLHPLRTWKEMKIYRQECHSNPLRFEFFKVNIRRHIKEIRPDIIHVHTTECVPTYFANLYNVPIICTMHGVFYRGRPDQKYLGDFLSSCVSHCDYFTGLTKECVFLMRKFFAISDDRLTIIPNGVNTRMYYYDVKERARLRDLHKVGDTIVFITVASLQERKGQLRFLKLLKQIGIDFKYWILGEGPDREKIDEFCKENNLTGQVTCFGNIPSEQLFKYYSAADIYAHTSTMEGQALCEMEAYATGLRTIVNERIKNTIVTCIDDTSIYHVLDYDSYNSDELISWIEKGNPNRSSKTDVNWQKIADKYVNYYNKVLNNYL